MKNRFRSTNNKDMQSINTAIVVVVVIYAAVVVVAVTVVVSFLSLSLSIYLFTARSFPRIFLIIQNFHKTISLSISLATIILCFVHFASNERINISHIFFLLLLLLLLGFALFLTLLFTNFTMLYNFAIPFYLHLLLLLNIIVSSTSHTIVVWLAPSILLVCLL